MNAVEIEEAVSQLAEQSFDPSSFPYAFLEAFGNKETTIKRLKSGQSNASDIEGGVLQRNNIHIAVCAAGKVAEGRRERMRQACERKFPKLHKWKANQHARTVLVLEDNDIQLTNHAIVAETYVPIALAMNNRPDETYLVSTVLDKWNAWPLMIGDISLIDMFDREENPRWEIEPATLTDITA
jgi:hypothetical protein